MFPSPCGEMGMKLGFRCQVLSRSRKKVSVPLRGNGYETVPFLWAFSLRLLPMVSVPLRGNGYETAIVSQDQNGVDRSFRPLAGKWV